MERKNTLIIFTLASVLVLTVFSANENAYAGVVPNVPNGPSSIPVVDDLHCYEIAEDNGLSQPIPLRLVDQFEDKIHNIISLDEICNPVTKIPTQAQRSSPLTDQHWTSYLLDTRQNPNPQVIATVNIVDQYHPNGFQTQVTDRAEFLMVPTEKDHNQNNFPNQSEIHFKCYELVQPQQPVVDSTFLDDQFGSSTYQELLPVEICNPVEKFFETQPGSGQFDQFGGGDNDIEEHYLCYEIFPEEDVGGFFSFSDQFLADSAEIVFDSVLCTLATKSIIPNVPIGGISIPIDQSALLLAGVQSISMWMIPVVIAGIGIGIFVIKRRN